MVALSTWRILRDQTRKGLFGRLSKRPLSEHALALERQVGKYSAKVSYLYGWGAKRHLVGKTPEEINRELRRELAAVVIVAIRNAQKLGATWPSFAKTVDDVARENQEILRRRDDAPETEAEVRSAHRAFLSTIGERPPR